MLGIFYIFCKDTDVIDILKEERRYQIKQRSDAHIKGKLSKKGKHYTPNHIKSRSRHRGHNHGRK